jgi:hypothetical protein
MGDSVEKRTQSLQPKWGFVMATRYLLSAALLSLSVVVLPGSTRTANAAEPLSYCKSDVARLCPGISPGGGKLLGCLKEHENEISVGCAKALKAMKTKMGK